MTTTTTTSSFRMEAVTLEDYLSPLSPAFYLTERQQMMLERLEAMPPLTFNKIWMLASSEAVYWSTGTHFKRAVRLLGDHFVTIETLGREKVTKIQPPKLEAIINYDLISARPEVLPSQIQVFFEQLESIKIICKFTRNFFNEIFNKYKPNIHPVIAMGFAFNHVEDISEDIPVHDHNGWLVMSKKVNFSGFFHGINDRENLFISEISRGFFVETFMTMKENDTFTEEAEVASKERYIFDHATARKYQCSQKNHYPFRAFNNMEAELNHRFKLLHGKSIQELEFILNLGGTKAHSFVRLPDNVTFTEPFFKLSMDFVEGKYVQTSQYFGGRR